MIIFDGTYRWQPPDANRRRPRSKWPFASRIRIVDLAAGESDRHRFRPIMVIAESAQALSETSCAATIGLAVCRDFSLDYRRILWIEYDAQKPEALYVANFRPVGILPGRSCCPIEWRPATPNERAAVSAFVAASTDSRNRFLA